MRNSTDSDLRTVSKPRCAREGCTEAAVKLSKYCSDRCGILVASSKLDLDKLDHDSASLDLLWDAVSSVKKLETVIKIVDDDNDKAGKISLIQDGSGQSTDIANGNNASSIIPKFDLQARIEEEQERLEKLQTTLAEYVTKRQKLDDSLALMNARLAYCKYAEKRWRMTCRQHISQSKTSGTSSSSSNKKSKSSAASASRGDSDNFPIPPDAPCGFDVRLIWKDEDWQNWLDSDQGRKLINAAEEVYNAIEEGRDASQYVIQNTDQGERNGDGEKGGNEEEEDGDEGLICTLTKKKCDRHTGWPVLREADFKVEKLGLERQLESVTDSERRIRRRVEDIEDFLRRANEKLAADKRSHASTPGLNGDTVEKVEDEGADGSNDERDTSMMVDDIPSTRDIALQA